MSIGEYHRDRVLSSILGILCLILFATINAPSARGQVSTTTGAGSDCIQTPADYRDAFYNCLPIRCISANLYGVIGQGTPEEQTTVYPPDFYWAWVAGHENLRKYFDWQLQACRGQLPESEVTRRILLFVGFGEDHIAPNTPYTLSVMDLGKNGSLFVPTWEAWFQAFQTNFGLRIPLSTQIGLTLGLSDPNQTSVPLDPTVTFAAITGCNAAAAARCDDQPLSACRSDYSLAARALQN